MQGTTAGIDPYNLEDDDGDGGDDDDGGDGDGADGGGDGDDADDGEDDGDGGPADDDIHQEALHGPGLL